jgi:hypothetical protein
MRASMAPTNMCGSVGHRGGEGSWDQRGRDEHTRGMDDGQFLSGQVDSFGLTLNFSPTISNVLILVAIVKSIPLY